MGAKVDGKTATERGIAPIEDGAIERLFDMRHASNGRSPRRKGDPSLNVGDVVVFAVDNAGNVQVTMGNVSHRGLAPVLAAIDSPRSEVGASAQVAFANLVQALETDLRQRRDRAEKESAQLGALLDGRAA